MRYHLSLGIVCLAVLANTAFAAEPARQYLDFSLAYSEGDFASSNTSRVSTLQLSYGKVQEGYDYSISLPFLMYSDAYGDDSGIGDVSLYGAVKLAGHTGKSTLYAAMQLKLPTADEQKGLGSGEMDVGASLAYTQYYGSTQFSLHAGYLVTGDNARQTYRDIAFYGVNVSKMILPWSVYVGLDGRQQTLAQGDDPLECSLGFLYLLQTDIFLRVEGLVGLNDASPDYGLSVGIASWF